MRQQAANTYKSFWQPRDASEVIAKNKAIAGVLNPFPAAHPPPQPPSMTIENSTMCVVNYPMSPGAGFTTDYTQDTFLSRKLGCTACGNYGWSQSGGIVLQTCSTIATIIQKPANPMPHMYMTSNGLSLICPDGCGPNGQHFVQAACHPQVPNQTYFVNGSLPPAPDNARHKAFQYG